MLGNTKWRWWCRRLQSTGRLTVQLGWLRLKTAVAMHCSTVIINRGSSYGVTVMTAAVPRTLRC